jgi:WD40 repeat protein
MRLIVRRRTLALLLLIAGGLAAPPRLPLRSAAGPTPAEVQKLIEQLGADEPAKRQEASKRLEEIGQPAVALLRKASKSHADPDVRLRAGLILRAIEQGAYGEVRHFGGNYGYWLNRVAFTADGRQCVATGGAVIRYDLETGRELGRVLELQFARNGLALSKDRRYFLTGHQHDTVVRLGEVQTGKVVQTFKGHTAGVHGVALSPDGSRALSGGDDKTLRLWDVKTGEELRRFAGGAGAVRCAAFAPDGRRALSGHYGPGSDFRVYLWDVETGKEVRAFKGQTGDVTAGHFLPDGRSFLSASLDGTLRLWDVEGGKELRQMGHAGGAYDAAVSPDGRRALSAGWDDRMVRLWDLAGGRQLHCFEGHGTRVLGVAFSPDGKRALSSDAAYTIFLWRLSK